MSRVTVKTAIRPMTVFVMLLDPVLSYQDVATHLGCSRERIRQIAKGLGLSTKDREQARGAAKLSEALKSPPPDDSPGGIVWREAGRQGFEIRRNTKHVSKSLWINERLCRLAWAGRASNTGGSMEYVQAKVPVVLCEFYIVVDQINKFKTRFFILPVDLLRSRYAGQIYIPTRWAPAYNNHYPSINWQEYENAWHLLN